MVHKLHMMNMKWRIYKKGLSGAKSKPLKSTIILAIERKTKQLWHSNTHQSHDEYEEVNLDKIFIRVKLLQFSRKKNKAPMAQKLTH